MEVQVQRSYAEMVVGDQGQGSVLDSQVTGEVAPKLERAQDKEITAVNHALQDMERLENLESIKETLLSLQKQISSYLRKLEQGWGEKEKETNLDQVVEGDGLKTGAPSGEIEAGLGLTQPIQIVEPVDKPTRQHIINRYHKKYVHRNPQRQQVRWRPIEVG